jgi:hypothetical protein
MYFFKFLSWKNLGFDKMECVWNLENRINMKYLIDLSCIFSFKINSIRYFFDFYKKCMIK